MRDFFTTAGGAALVTALLGLGVGGLGLHRKLQKTGSFFGCIRGAGVTQQFSFCTNGVPYRVSFEFNEVTLRNAVRRLMFILKIARGYREFFRGQQGP